MNKGILLAYLDGRRRPIGADPQAGALHRAILDAAPGFYLELLGDAAADVSQRREALANLLDADGVGREAILERLRAQPVDEALAVLEVVRREGRNGKRARAIGLSFLLGHERLAELVAARRTRLLRLLRHLLGERTWSSVVRCLRTGAVSDRAGPDRPAPTREPADPEAFLRRTVLRYAADPESAREALRVLAGVAFEPRDPALARRLAARHDLAQGAGLPRATLFGLRGTFHPKAPAGRVRMLSASAVAAASAPEDGPLTGLFKRALAIPGEPPAREDVSERVTATAAGLPAVDAAIALVLDLSGSAASSGERANHPAALGLALAALIRDRARAVRLYQVGGSGRINGASFARPEGATDLASAVLDAARGRPDAILVCTDGYENARQGDTAAVVDGLRRLGLTTPVVQVTPLFAASEDLARRRLGEGIPLLTVEHERQVGELLARVALARGPETLSLDDLDRLRRLLFRR